MYEESHKQPRLFFFFLPYFFFLCAQPKTYPTQWHTCGFCQSTLSWPPLFVGVSTIPQAMTPHVFSNWKQRSLHVASEFQSDSQTHFPQRRTVFTTPSKMKSQLPSLKFFCSWSLEWYLPMILRICQLPPKSTQIISSQIKSFLGEITRTGNYDNFFGRKKQFLGKTKMQLVKTCVLFLKIFLFFWGISRVLGVRDPPTRILSFSLFTSFSFLLP